MSSANRSRLRIVTEQDVVQWCWDDADLTSATAISEFPSESDSNIGISIQSSLVELQGVELPLHLRVAIGEYARQNPGKSISIDEFASISFFSLCKGLYLPLCGLADHRATSLFGFVCQPRSKSNASSNAALIQTFFERDLGISMTQKLAAILGDPFEGNKSQFRRDSLLRLLLSICMISREEALAELAQQGDIAILFAKNANRIRGDLPLTAAEVFYSIRAFPSLTPTQRFHVLRSLYARCGRLEAYFLTKLVLRNAGFGSEYQGELLTASLASHFKVPVESVEHSMALTDPFQVVRTLTEHGQQGLQAIQLKPLSPVRPALASSGIDSLSKYPTWVERKYDGIRLLLHKSTDPTGAILCGAYTRNRKDWLELIPGLNRTIQSVPANSCIIDGELFGTILNFDGPRPASVYEVYAMLQGEPSVPVNLKFAAFDLLFLNDVDVTSTPLFQRRQMLSALITPLQNGYTPLPLHMAEGQLAQNKEEVNRLFQHFRSQGYEGIIAKDLNGTYHLAARDPSWLKRKPEITLDLVITGGTMAVTTKENAGMFGSYVISARRPTPQGFEWEVVGDVAGLDAVRDRQIQAEIQQNGLLTGQKFESQSASGTRPGWHLRPHIVVTIKFEGVIKETGMGKSRQGTLSLRDPKIAMIRSDKPALEADTIRDIEEIYLDQSLS